MKKELGIRTLDLAKRLLDHGFHPPTVYFPLLVDEALLIEPTETETQARRSTSSPRRSPRSSREAARGPEIALNAPYTTPVRRLDEAGRRQAPGHPPAALTLSARRGRSRSASSSAASRRASCGRRS